MLLISKVQGVTQVISLVGLQWTGRACMQLYSYWVYNGPAKVASSYIISGSTTDQPSLHVAIWLVGLQWTGRRLIQLYHGCVCNGPAEVLSSYIISGSTTDQPSLHAAI